MNKIMMTIPAMKTDQPFEVILPPPSQPATFRYAVRQGQNDRWYILELGMDKETLTCSGAFESQEIAVNELIQFMKMVETFQAQFKATR